MHLLSMTPHIICYPSTRVIPREYPLVLYTRREYRTFPFLFPIGRKQLAVRFFQPSPRTIPADAFHLSCSYCPEASRCRFFHVQPILRLPGTAGLWHTPCHKPLRIQAAYARQSVEETEFAPWEIWGATTSAMTGSSRYASPSHRKH